MSHDHYFDLATRELTLNVTVPDPSQIPTVKEYKYVKAKDEFTATALPVKDQKARYAGAVWQVAVRTLHEVFEADRAAKIHSISLTVGTGHISPATGLPETVPWSWSQRPGKRFWPSTCPTSSRRPRSPPGCGAVEVAFRPDPG